MKGSLAQGCNPLIGDTQAETLDNMLRLLSELEVRADEEGGDFLLSMNIQLLRDALKVIH